jgi:hypothetical protein
VKHFPAFSIDNFYDNADDVQAFALSQTYTAPALGEYPGARTESLHEIDQEFTQKFCYKLFSLFYNFNNEQVNWEITTYFQKITPYENPRTNVGWTHMDDNTILAGLIYLTPGAGLDSGTSLLSIKEGERASPDYKIKCNFYKNETADIDQYIRSVEEHNDKFIETTRFNNVYNTLVAYPGETYHRANNFDCGQSERLTQVFFVNRIHTIATPIERSKIVV